MGPGAFGWVDKMVIDLDVKAGAAEGCRRPGSEASVGAGQARGPDRGDLQVMDSQTNARCSTKNNQICNFCAKSDSIFSWIPGRAGELYQVPEI